MTVTFLNDQRGTLLEHHIPLYPPHLAPMCDFWLFLKLKRVMNASKAAVDRRSGRVTSVQRYPHVCATSSVRRSNVDGTLRDYFSTLWGRNLAPEQALMKKSFLRSSVVERMKGDREFLSSFLRAHIPSVHPQADSITQNTSLET